MQTFSHLQTRVVTILTLDIAYLLFRVPDTLYLVNRSILTSMPYAGCVFLWRTSTSHFQLDNTRRPGTTYRIVRAQIEDFITYDEMLRSGREGLSVPLGYNEFAEIFNSAPGVLTCFAYIPEGQETLLGSGPSPNRREFWVAPNDLYHT